MNRLPSTRVLVVGALVASSLLIAFAFAGDQTVKRDPSLIVRTDGTSNPTITSDENLLQIAQTDSLADWKTTLSESGFSSGTTNETNLTTTDQIGRQVLAGFLSLRDAGLLDDPTSQELVLKQAIGALEAESGTHYTKKDIQVVIENPETLKAYLKSARTAITKTFDVPENELSVFARGIDNNSDRELAKLVASARIYQEITADLQRSPVPESAATVHLSLMNNFSDLAAAVNTMSRYYQDTWGALASVKKIPEIQNALQQSMQQMSTYFTVRQDSL